MSKPSFIKRILSLGTTGEAADVATEGVVATEALETVLQLLNPFTPHICEEMWARLGHSQGLVHASWPAFDEEAARCNKSQLLDED